MKNIHLVSFKIDVSFNYTRRFLETQGYHIMTLDEFYSVSDMVAEKIRVLPNYRQQQFLVHDDHVFVPAYPEALSVVCKYELGLLKLCDVRGFNRSQHVFTHRCTPDKLWCARNTVFVVCKLDSLCHKSGNREDVSMASVGRSEFSTPFVCHMKIEDLPYVTRYPAYSNHNRVDEQVGFSRWNGDTCRFLNSSFTAKMEYARGEGLFGDIDFET